MKAFLLIGVGVLVIMSLVYFLQKSSITNQANATPSSATPLISTSNIVASNLEVPWAIAFLPDKKMLVTERLGRVRLIDENGNLRSEPVATLNVLEIGEGGLLGITLHPNFSSNSYVYLYYTYEGNGNSTLNRVVRMVYQDGKLGNEQAIVDNIPGASNHNGGRIKFGPDGFLYITTGDAENPSQAQDTNSLAGKILRVRDDGQPVLGNPFNNLVYSYGHRNPQGIAWDSSGKLWQTEHGRSNPTGFDEVNLIQIGKNYGWPDIQGDEEKSGMEVPKLNSGPDTTWAPAGGVIVGNSFFFVGLRGQTLFEAVIENNQIVRLEEHLKGQYGRLREVVLGSDEMLYIATSNRDGRGNPDISDDRIIRIDPKKL